MRVTPEEVRANLRALRLPPAPVVNEATRALWRAQGLYDCPTRLMLDFPGLRQVPDGYVPTEQDIADGMAGGTMTDNPHCDLPRLYLLVSHIPWRGDMLGFLLTVRR